MYNYAARIVRWIDGDTFEAEVDLGFFVSYRSNFRAYGINAPEVRGASREAGLAARNYASTLAPPGSFVNLTTTKADKYGRWLASFPINSTGQPFSHEMIEAGHAVPYFG